MARARIDDGIGSTAVRTAIAGDADRNTTATAVRYLLQLLTEQAEGNTVEVRVPRLVRFRPSKDPATPAARLPM